MSEETATLEKSPANKDSGPDRRGAAPTTSGGMNAWARRGLASSAAGAAPRGTAELPGRLTPQDRARLLYEYCISSEKRVGESTHNLFTIAEHYAEEHPEELENPEVINGIPPFFANLTAQEKSVYCYNQVIESLALEAMPVTVESLRATQRTNPSDPTSSYAGRFVQRVTSYVSYSLVAVLLLYLSYQGLKFAVPELASSLGEGRFMQWVTWVVFGCIGALVHLLNNALTTTRLQTFEISEERKVWPRILLGGMFGFVLPWILTEAGPLDVAEVSAVGSIAAFFGGYSVRFSIGLLERILAALFPETPAKQ